MSEAAEERAATLALELVRLRTKAGLSQHQLADKSGVSRSVIATIESGAQSQIGVALNAYRLADALDVPVEHWRPYLEAAAELPPSPPRGKLK